MVTALRGFSDISGTAGISRQISPAVSLASRYSFSTVPKFLPTGSVEKILRAWATESSKGHRHSCCERLRIVRSFARHVSSMDARTEIPPSGTMRQPETVLRPYMYFAGRDRPAFGSGAQIVFTARTPPPYVLPSGRIAGHNRYESCEPGRRVLHRHTDPKPSRVGLIPGLTSRGSGAFPGSGGIPSRVQ